MENIALVQQIIEINRVVVENTWKVLTLLQDQTERVSRSVWEQGNNIVQEGQHVLEEWTKEYKRGQQAVRDVVDENHINLELLFSPPKPAHAPVKKAKKVK